MREAREGGAGGMGRGYQEGSRSGTRMPGKWMPGKRAGGSERVDGMFPQVVILEIIKDGVAIMVKGGREALGLSTSGN